MERLEFLVEEPSAAEVLRAILPKILDDTWVLDENYFIRRHEGKNDLKKSIPSKIRAFGKSQQKVGIIVLQDQDSNDCKALKADLVKLCADNANGNTPYLVRIACHELEAWYIGDVEALGVVFPRFKPENHKNKAMFRNPDACVNPKNMLKRMLGEYSQISKAKEIGVQLNVNNNRSESFNQFVSGVKRFIARP